MIASPVRPLGTWRRDVPVARVEDAEQVAVAQPADVREGGITPGGFPGADDLVLRWSVGRPEE